MLARFYVCIALSPAVPTPHRYEVAGLYRPAKHTQHKAAVCAQGRRPFGEWLLSCVVAVTPGTSAHRWCFCAPGQQHRSDPAARYNSPSILIHVSCFKGVLESKVSPTTRRRSHDVAKGWSWLLHRHSCGSVCVAESLRTSQKPQLPTYSTICARFGLRM
jgi:hypothetical protein